MSKFSDQYRGKVEADNERERSRRSNYGHLLLPQGVKVFKVEGGDKVYIDILPYFITDEHHPCRNNEKGIGLPGTQWYRKPYKLHRNVGSNNESAVCLTSVGKRCPICDYRAKLQKERKAEEEEIKALRPSDRNLYVVVPIGHKDYDEEPHIFDISKFCFQDALSEETKENPEYEIFFDPTSDGYTLAVRFSEEAFGKNKFAAVSRIDFKERKDGYDDAFQKSVPNLDTILQILPYKELEAKFFELDVEAAEESPEIEEETPTRTRKHVEEEAPVSKRRHVPDDDEPPTRTRRHVPEDEPEERPRRRSAPEEEAPVKGRRFPVEDEEPAPKQSTKVESCVPCEGTGQDSKGRECPICQGTGIKPKKASAAPAEDHKELKRRQRQEAAEPATEKCPYGHVFGKDCDKFTKDCGDCKLWDPCFEASGSM